MRFAFFLICLVHPLFTFAQTPQEVIDSLILSDYNQTSDQNGLTCYAPDEAKDIADTLYVVKREEAYYKDSLLVVALLLGGKDRHGQGPSEFGGQTRIATIDDSGEEPRLIDYVLGPDFNHYRSEFSLDAVTYAMRAGEPLVALTAGYDTDGDGDEITLYLYRVTNETLEGIFSYTVRSSSGDGCNTEQSEADIRLEQIGESEYFTIIAIERSSTDSACDEDRSESCTRTARNYYGWDGKGYALK